MTARHVLIRVAIIAVKLPAVFFWRFAHWQSRLETTHANELADEGHAADETAVCSGVRK